MRKNQPQPPNHPMDAVASRNVPHAAVALLKKPTRDLERSLRRIAARQACTEKQVHAIRVACRRVESALVLCEPTLERESASKLARALKKVRRAAGLVRDVDVHRQLLETLTTDQDEPTRKVLVQASDAVRSMRRPARNQLLVAAKGVVQRIGRFAGIFAAAADVSEASVAPQPGVESAVREVWRTQGAKLIAAARSAASDLSTVKRVHRLRIALKAVRYTLSACDHWLGRRAARPLLQRLTTLQRSLGEVNDAHTLQTRVQELHQGGALNAAAAKKALEVVTARLDAALEAFRTDWKTAGQTELLDAIESLGAGPAMKREPPVVPSGRSRPPSVVARPGHHSIGAAKAHGPAASPVRIGAIDIGSNSIRLIIAEAAPDGTYRILDDEKETTRLATGLDSTRNLDERAMEQSACAIKRMRSIAEGFGLTRLRAVATCAVREAENGDRFCDLVRRWAGLELEVISAQQEARLAYSSAASAFDLSLLTTAVVDIGGGSTEVVLSGGGLVERVYTIPIGAVRLTERYGGGVAASGQRWNDLRAGLSKLLDEHIENLPVRPGLVIGTGGTTTSLGNIVLQARRADPGTDRRTSDVPRTVPLAAVQGLEMRRSMVKSVLSDLRAMTLQQRAAVPGLTPDRSDIIVPGIAILHAIMKRLGAKRLRIHTGGIRDGLLLAMVREAFPGAASGAGAARVDPLRAVKRLAEACRFDRAHSEHVAHLGLRMLDQLGAARAEGTKPTPRWAGPEARLLLQAAAHLLDVGYVINYQRHHIHSYNLIRNSDLPGLSPRQVELIALIARYHRAAEPKSRHAPFAALSADDRDLVRRLSAIVRIAVGLDRAHAQTVRDIRVVLDADAVRFIADAKEEPVVDLWAAEQKSAMFQQVFRRKAGFSWAGAIGEPGMPGLAGTLTAAST